MEGAPKYVASEMCEIFADHWGYAKNDFNFKSLRQMITELCDCRRYGSNMLMNVGPKGDGSLRTLDKAMLETMGEWVKMNEEAIFEPRPTNVEILLGKDDFVLKKDEIYYLFCHNIPTALTDPNVVKATGGETEKRIKMPKKIQNITWLDNGEAIPFTQEANGETTIGCKPFAYGDNFVVRVAKIQTED